MQKTYYFLMIALAFIADQISKWMITELVVRPHLGEGFGTSYGLFDWFMHATERLPFTSIKVGAFFNITMVWNQGISFGILNEGTAYGTLLLSGISLGIATIFIVWLMRSQSKLQCFGISLVVAGALGNVVDRFRFGAVIDFLDFHIEGYHWPSFNVADSLIFIGVFLLIIQSFFFETRPKSAT